MCYGLLHFNAKIAHRLLRIFYVRKQIFKVAQHRQKIELNIAKYLILKKILQHKLFFVFVYLLGIGILDMFVEKT